VSRLEILLAVWLLVLTVAVAVQIVQIREAVGSLFAIDYNTTIALNWTVNAFVDLSRMVANNSKDIKNLESRIGSLSSEVS
jgi:hypothetical protein